MKFRILREPTNSTPGQTWDDTGISFEGTIEDLQEQLTLHQQQDSICYAAELVEDDEGNISPNVPSDWATSTPSLWQRITGWFS